MIILYILLAILSLILILAAIFKKAYAIREEVLIHKPIAEVFNYLKYLKNLDNFNKWVMIDSNVRKKYTGTDNTVGFIAAWDSNLKQVGKGEQEITGITKNERIDYEIRFEKPFKSTSPVFFKTESIDANSTKVTWGFDGAMPYPMNIMITLFQMEKQLGKDLQESLGTLKSILEK